MAKNRIKIRSSITIFEATITLNGKLQTVNRSLNFVREEFADGRIVETGLPPGVKPGAPIVEVLAAAMDPANTVEWINAAQRNAKFSRIGYCRGTQTLFVEARDGTLMEYRNVSPSDFTRLKQARSKTEFIRREIGARP